MVADLNADSHAEILIPNDVGELLCFSRNSQGIMNLTWRVPGHGMLWQYSSTLEYGVAVDDLNHDGYKEIIVSGANEVGAVIFVVRSQWQIVMEKSFSRNSRGEITLFDGILRSYGTAQSTEAQKTEMSS